MERQWRLGDDLITKDNLLDGFTFDDVILALHTESRINEATARRVLQEILAVRMQDLNYLFENNLDIIIAKAREGRGDY